MFQKILLSVLIVLLLAITPLAFAGKIELTTYYPAPMGEYDKLQSKGSCVGTACEASDVPEDSLKIKKTAAGTGGDLTVERNVDIQGEAKINSAKISTMTGTTNMSGVSTVTGTTTVSNTGNFVIQKRSSAPSNPVEGQIWIE